MMLFDQNMNVQYTEMVSRKIFGSIYSHLKVLVFIQHSSGHFAGLCCSSEASWGVPKLIHLYNLLSQLVRQQRRGTKLRGHTSSWNLLTLIIKSFSPLKQLLQGYRS
nr:hypothetical protein CFP56_46996 [Quercus suber]